LLKSKKSAKGRNRLPFFCRLIDAAWSGKWWSQTGSNRRPPACKAGALPAELWPHFDLSFLRLAALRSSLSRSRTYVRSLLRSARALPDTKNPASKCRGSSVNASMIQILRTSREILVGLGRFELPTSPLSGVRSNQLSYRPGDCAVPRSSSSEARTIVQGCLLAIR
jgi:hypothetical protein